MLTQERQFDLMMKWEQEGLTEEEAVELFQGLIDNGMAWTLQGMYGRQAAHMIETGAFHRRAA